MYVAREAIEAFEKGATPPELYGKHNFITYNGTKASRRTIRRWYAAWEDGEATSFDPNVQDNDIPSEDGTSKFTWKEQQNRAEATMTPDRIMTLDDALTAFGINLEVWEVDKVVINKWEVGRKDKMVSLEFNRGVADGYVEDTGKIFVEPLIQIKVWLNKRVSHTVSEAFVRVLDELREFSPTYEPPERQAYEDGHLLAPQIWDYHFGNLPITGAESLGAAEEKFKAVVRNMVKTAVSMPFPIERIVLPVGNDLVQVDNLDRTTTKGTPQNVSHDPRDIVEVAFRCMAYYVDEWLKIAPVDVMVVPSNHDRYTTFFLGMFLEARFSNHPEFAIDMGKQPRKYYQFHQCLFGMDHGSENKPADMGAIMAEETNGMTGRVNHKEFWRGHIHQRIKMHYEFMPGRGFYVRYLPSLAKTDDWHHKFGYISAGRSAELIFYHKSGIRAELPITEDN